MFRQEFFRGRRVLTSSFLDGESVNSQSVTAFFTTRDLPLKSGERDDLIDEVENNKKLICEEFKIPLENLVIPIQTHSDNVEIIDLNKKSYPECDALVTNQANIAIALNFADCVPVIFYDPTKKVIAVAHAGWRGTVAKIGPKTVDKMVQSYGCKPEDIIALIGPVIGKCCFEVKEDVLEQIINSVDGQTGEAISGMHADLKLINKIQLLASGLKKIDLCEYCTSCQSELFFSYRKENAKTARHSAVIILR